MNLLHENVEKFNSISNFLLFFSFFLLQALAIFILVINSSKCTLIEVATNKRTNSKQTGKITIIYTPRISHESVETKRIGE